MDITYSVVADFLENGSVGEWVENDNARIEIVNMCGGRYLITDLVGDICGLTNSVANAIAFLDEF